MIKVFLVEDEVVIRHGIKHSINWEKEGYEFVGEASDGELAYPLIKKSQPDILITDIKMPFMNGLELSELVKKEIPNIKILILSGYNEFDYAKKAISIGVTEYLLKPIDADKLLEALGEIRKTIQRERDEKELLEQYFQEMKENTEHEKFKFFNRLIEEKMSIAESLETAEHFDILLSALAYNIVLFKVFNKEEQPKNEQLVSACMNIEDLVSQMSEIYFFQRGVEGWAFLFTGEDDTHIQESIQKLEKRIEHLMEGYGELEYFGGIGETVSRLRELKESFSKASRAFAKRFVLSPNQFLKFNVVQQNTPKETVEMQGLGSMNENRELIDKFLKNGTETEVETFVEAYFARISDNNLKSMIMLQYIVMDTYICVVAFGEKLGVEKEKIEETCGDIKKLSAEMTDGENIRKYMGTVLHNMISLRDTVSGRRYSDIITVAKSYISENYMTEDISLNTVSARVNLSPSYFSSIFSQEVGQTFVEYLTEVRMEKAKELLMCSSMKTTEIGYEVGYKDSHYFSYIFKKTQSCSPKEYRARGKEK